LIECLSSARLVSTHRPESERETREAKQRTGGDKERRRGGGGGGGGGEAAERGSGQGNRRGEAEGWKRAREGQGKGIIKRRKRKVGERGTRGGMGRKESGEMP